jgi:nitrate/TMAO reductase-like tetraheme cytochrome c subunit
MKNKMLLIGIAIVAVGLFALPQTYALFVGQHNWYDTQTSENGVPCGKCHADVVAEINAGTGGVNLAHRGQTSDGGCQACHMTAPATEPGVSQGPGGTFHAAAAPACLDCHSGTAGGGLSAVEVTNGADEVHKPFVNQATTAGFLKSSNEACISCHTHVAVDIAWTKATTISLSAAETSDINGHSWTVGNYLATGTATFSTNGAGDGNGTSTAIVIAP